MRLDQNPVYRKVIVPWYDSEIACLILIVFMFVVFLFGFIGISVAQDTPEYRSFIWVPALIMVLSGIVIISTTIRLIKRYASLKNKSK
ncbi:MAG: hypothetical protein JRH18_08450 [Deltaproteobacteria bacterium]|nr:hypothetical protein [Deltaproteobacteria bacterium]MBW1961240.1 hypothetical protein [Deltaproteobacteria bacterium]MBW1995109.1 hypothetical protein [Deltaproteobacteria bacterium]MBW2151681.1 hypothetical protein [Deltaproteobacteria bacterium]